MSRGQRLAERSHHRFDTAQGPNTESDPAKHVEALRLSSVLTETYRHMYRPTSAMVNPKDVIERLNQAGVKFVLMGTHGIGGWRDEPRATQDVDILVQKRHHRKAVNALRQAYPELTVQDQVAVTRFIDPATGKGVIDLLRPLEPVYQIVFKNTISIEDTHSIPDLEMALVSKFAAMISPNRPEDKKYIDAGDIINMVGCNREDIDTEKLRRLGEAVYLGGGAEVVKLVEDIKAGRRLHL